MLASPIDLHPFPMHAHHGVERICTGVARHGAGLRLDYQVIGDASRVRLVQSSGGDRRDGLWQHTCLEAFIRLENATSYLEFNFAPNGDWAAYEFDDYRQNNRDLTTQSPKIERQVHSNEIMVSVTLPELPQLYQSQAIQIGLSAVIETPQNERSYWALFHPSDTPDFHRIEKFQISLD